MCITDRGGWVARRMIVGCWIGIVAGDRADAFLRASRAVILRRSAKSLFVYSDRVERRAQLSAFLCGRCGSRALVSPCQAIRPDAAPPILMKRDPRPRAQPVAWSSVSGE